MSDYRTLTPSQQEQRDREIMERTPGTSAWHAKRQAMAAAADNHGWDAVMRAAAPHRFAAQARRPAHG